MNARWHRSCYGARPPSAIIPRAALHHDKCEVVNGVSRVSSRRRGRESWLWEHEEKEISKSKLETFCVCRVRRRRVPPPAPRRLRAPNEAAAIQRRAIFTSLLCWKGSVRWKGADHNQKIIIINNNIYWPNFQAAFKRVPKRGESFCAAVQVARPGRAWREGGRVRGRVKTDPGAAFLGPWVEAKMSGRLAHCLGGGRLRRGCVFYLVTEANPVSSLPRTRGKQKLGELAVCRLRPGRCLLRFTFRRGGTG